jgi:hypothetical protein
MTFLPTALAAIVLLTHARGPRLDSRLWFDGIIAGMTVGALSAARGWLDRSWLCCVAGVATFTAADPPTCSRPSTSRSSPKPCSKSAGPAACC